PTGTGSFDPDFDPTEQRRRRVAQELRDAEFALRQKRQEIADEILRLETDFATFEAEKHHQRIAFLREEIALIDQEIERLRTRLDLEGDAEVREARPHPIRSRGGERHGVGGRLRRWEGAPDPNSPRVQMLATVPGLENRIETMAQSIARAFSGVIGTA